MTEPEVREAALTLEDVFTPEGDAGTIMRIAMVEYGDEYASDMQWAALLTGSSVGGWYRLDELTLSTVRPTTGTIATDRYGN